MSELGGLSGYVVGFAAAEGRVIDAGCVVGYVMDGEEFLEDSSVELVDQFAVLHFSRKLVTGNPGILTWF